MKFKRLEIRNLASIETAEIDFEKGPLARHPIFLICGETGSGKSTLLDAICLALYDNSPRFEASSSNSFEVKNLQIRNNDQKQILKENTVEGWARLDFEGNDGKAYAARWTVRRLRRSLEREPKREWSLSWVDGGQEQTLVQVWEIKAKIQEVVGLSFEQFCRTSMLAQGEFTRFLKSNDNEKADILEKLADAGYFAKVGERIYQKAAAKQQACQEAEREIALLEVLSPEELQGLQAEKAGILSQLEACGRRLDDLQGKCNWLEKEQQLQQQAATAREGLSSAKAAMESEAYKEKEQLRQDWEQSVEARLCRKNLAGIGQEEEGVEAALAEALQELARLLSGKQALEQALAQEETAIGQLQDRLKAEEEHRDMYRESQAILVRLQAVAEAREAYRDASKKKRQAEADILEKQKEAEELAGKIEGLRPAIDQQEEKLQALQEECGKADLQDLHEKQSAASLRLEKIEDAKRKLEDIGRIVEAQDRLQKEAGELSLQQKKLGQESEALEKSEEDAGKELDEAGKLLEAVKSSVGDLAKALRAALHVGDACPVCGAKVSALLRDEDFQKAYDPVKQRYEEAGAACREIAGKQSANQSKQEICRKSLETLREKEEECGQDFGKASAAFAGSLRKAGIEAAGIEPEGKEPAQPAFWEESAGEDPGGIPWAEIPLQMERISRLLEAEASAAGKEKENLENAIRAANAQAKALQAMQTAKDGLLKQEKELTGAQSKCKADLAALQAGRSAWETQMDASRKTVDDQRQALEESISWPDWKEAFASDPEAFKKRLREASEAFLADSKALEDKAHARDLRQKERDSANESLSAMKKQLGQAFPAEVSGKWEGERPPKDLPKLCTALQARFASLLSQKESCARQRAEIAGKLAGFHASYPGIGPERLDFLMGHATEAEEARQYSERCRKAFTEAEAAVAQAGKLLQTHAAGKPALSEGEDRETLPGLLEESRRESGRLNRELGALEQRLDADSRRRKGLEEKIRHRDALQADFLQWDRLNRLFGDATGAKFRRIVLNFIMDELLSYANEHLCRLSDRYRLESSPGSFVVLVRDLHDGGSLRSAASLSGGESFLVSLALALGLASFGGTRLSTDILFIDEGFGTLSSNALEPAIEALERLQQRDGRKVGLISHVGLLQERIRAQVRVERADPTRSRVWVTD